LQDDHIESDEELPKKTKSFFANAAETFDAAFYAKVNDDIYINVGMCICPSIKFKLLCIRLAFYSIYGIIF
jgi:hypothetical protein